MKRFALALFCALSAGIALAAPPALDIPADIKATGGYVRFTPKTDAVTVLYISLDGADPFPSEELKDARRFLLPTAALKPGKYRFVAVAAGATGEQSRGDFTVTIPGVIPDPNPNPGPGPTPQPNPVVPAGKRFIVIVEETSQAVPARGAIMANAELQARIKSQGHAWRIVDKDNKTTSGSAPADIKDYLAEAAGKTLPRLYLVAPDGTVLFKGDAPNGNDAPAQLLKLLTTYGG